jgi:hypothetical protein
MEEGMVRTGTDLAIGTPTALRMFAAGCRP